MKRHVVRSLPGVLGTLLLVLVVTETAVAGAASLFYEGWGQPVVHMLGYFAPALVLLVLGVLTLRSPAGGGGLLLVVVLGAGSWWVLRQLERQMAPLAALLVSAAMMAGPLIVAALFFMFEARHRRLLRQEGVVRSSRRLARHWGLLLLIGMPAVAVAIMSAQQLPALLARQDDGQRGARVIAGNGLRLMWAPEGPGWNWRAPDAGYPTWDSVMHHSNSPHDRCAYLDEPGTRLLAAPTHIWRMPAADEIVRSLTRNAKNAGCAWDGRSDRAECQSAPDKETPLWAPDQAPIYYWSAQAAGPTTAFAVNYTAGISVLPRSRPQLGIGFRCVKEVGPGDAQ